MLTEIRNKWPISAIVLFTDKTTFKPELYLVALVLRAENNYNQSTILYYCATQSIPQAISNKAQYTQTQRYSGKNIMTIPNDNINNL